MTNQEIFNRVAKHLITQDAKAQNPEGHCFYRMEDGRKCSVGCLIPDDKYNQKMEDVGSLWEYYCPESGEVDLYNDDAKLMLEAIGATESQIPLLSALQDIHDRCEVSLWRRSLHALAKRYNFDYSVLGDF